MNLSNQIRGHDDKKYDCTNKIYGTININIKIMTVIITMANTNDY